MKFVDFINKRLGTKIDFDGVYGAQCVDLFRQYAKDVCNVPVRMEGVEGAKDLYLNYENMPIEKKYFARKNAHSVAQMGDVVVWNATATNSYGHVAIVVCNEPKGLLVLEQNGFTQAGTLLAERSRDNLLGFLEVR
jgi:hypothetical protein